MMLYLSYPITSHIPVYGTKEARPEVRQIKSLKKGDTSQTYWIGMENHWGTHVDCPAHFFPQGKKIIDYDAGFWFFPKPQIICVKTKPGHIISRNDLATSLNRETDLLLLKSGWSKIRNEGIYSVDNPGVEPELGMWLRKEYPSLRVIGFDWISLSSYKNKKVGQEAHRVFLDPSKEGHPILIIEDMRIPDEEGLSEVLVAPYLIEGIDSAPCTVFGIFDDKNDNF